MFCLNCGALLDSRGCCPVCSSASAVQSASPAVQQPPGPPPRPKEPPTLVTTMVDAVERLWAFINKSKVIRPLAFPAFVILIYTQVTFFVVHPMGAVPEGGTLLILRMEKLRFIDSAEGVCEREPNGVSLICLADVFGTVARKSTVIARLPYSETLYRISADGRKYDTSSSASSSTSNFEPNTAPTPPDAQTQKLIAERDYEMQQLRFHESMLAASSFAVRTDLFCRDAADAYLANGISAFGSTAPITNRVEAEMELERELAERMDPAVQSRENFVRSIKHGPYGLTLNDLNNAYAQLMREEPSTREAEMWRDQKLYAIREVIAAYNKEFRDCRVAVIYGEAPGPPRVGIRPLPPLPLPTDDELRKKCSQGRERIAQIERELASRR